MHWKALSFCFGKSECLDLIVGGEWHSGIAPKTPDGKVIISNLTDVLGRAFEPNQLAKFAEVVPGLG